MRKKVAISDGPLDPMPFPEWQGLQFSGDVVSRPVFPLEPDSLALWHHELAPGTAIAVARPLEDHAFYVLSGTFEVGEAQLEEGGVLCVAKDATATILAREAGLLIHYVGDAQSRPPKAGGCIHILSAKGIFSDEREADGFRVAKVMYADSTCPTCDVWLHKSSYEAGRVIRPHCHNEDEIINVLEGDLMLGTRAMKKGSAVAVVKNAFYSFAAGPQGLTFLNFRQGDPLIHIKGDDPSVWRSEGEIMRLRARAADAV